jgi:serine/threonine-protein phosphatase 2B catalytic subunit
MHKWDGPQSFPYVITLFSAPNYCGYYDNKAAVLILDDGNLSLKQYDETEPPYRLPNNLDVFSWSIPFLIEKVISIFFQIFVKVSTEDLDELNNEAVELIND